MDVDEALLVEAAKTDPEAFARLTDRYAPRAYRWCRALTANEEDIKDIIQEAFIRLYRSLPQLADTARFGAWFRRLVANAAYDWFRKYRAPYELQSIETVLEQQGESLDSVIEQRNLRQLVMESLTQLSAVNRITFKLFYERGLKISEIATLLGVSETAVKSRLSRAKAQLRGQLAPLVQGEHRHRAYRTTVICASHRRGGVSRQLADAVTASLGSASPASTVRVLELADLSIASCRSCSSCARTGHCCQSDDFDGVLGTLLDSDAIVVISPYYAPIPSRLAALLERLMAVSIMPVVAGDSAARGFPLQKRWCAVLHFGADQRQGYMASIIRESLVSMGLGLVMTEREVSFDAPVVDHARALGPLLVRTLTQQPDSDAVENWFDYWNDENLKMLERGWTAEIRRARRGE